MSVSEQSALFYPKTSSTSIPKNGFSVYGKASFPDTKDSFQPLAASLTSRSEHLPGPSPPWAAWGLLGAVHTLLPG